MIYTVLDKRTLRSIGSYQADTVTIKSPYTDTINEIHYEVEAGKYPQGYYLNPDFTVSYDFSYEPPASPPLVIAALETEYRHEKGFELYRKILADIALSGSMSVIDDVILVDDYLSKMRNFLKDGRGETALRYLIKHIEPLGIFSADKILEYKTWIREFCIEFMPDGYADLAAYEARLDAVESEVTI